MPEPSHPALTTLKVPIAAQDHAQGPADAPVTLLEYGDYQCPHCGRVFPVVERLLQAHAGRLRVVFRHFPLIKMHTQAKLAAEAAEAAGSQGKFWEMHRLLYTHQDHLAPDDLAQYAREIGLDLTRFEHELESHLYGPRVMEDLAGAMRSGVNGTPAIFINGLRYAGPKDEPGLAAAIEQAMNNPVPGGQST